jgi:H/ACA ribonucleoprotein complex subunit 1
MSFRGNRGRGRGNFGGRGRGGRGGYHQDQGPPEHVIEIGSFLHPCENDLVCKSTHAKIPYFNAPIYLENKTQIGKIDDIFGPMTDFVSTRCFISERFNTPNMEANSILNILILTRVHDIKSCVNHMMTRV